jgi:hypothetical protein
MTVRTFSGRHNRLDPTFHNISGREIGRKLRWALVCEAPKSNLRSRVDPPSARCRRIGKMQSIATKQRSSGTTINAADMERAMKCTPNMFLQEDPDRYF